MLTSMQLDYLQKAAQAEVWARRTFYLCGVGFATIAMLILFK